MTVRSLIMAAAGGAPPLTLDKFDNGISVNTYNYEDNGTYYGSSVSDLAIYDVTNSYVLARGKATYNELYILRLNSNQVSSLSNGNTRVGNYTYSDHHFHGTLARSGSGVLIGIPGANKSSYTANGAIQAVTYNSSGFIGGGTNVNYYWTSSNTQGADATNRRLGARAAAIDGHKIFATLDKSKITTFRGSGNTIGVHSDGNITFSGRWSNWRQDASTVVMSRWQGQTNTSAGFFSVVSENSAGSTADPFYQTISSSPNGAAAARSADIKGNRIFCLTTDGDVEIYDRTAPGYSFSYTAKVEVGTNSINIIAITENQFMVDQGTTFWGYNSAAGEWQSKDVGGSTVYMRNVGASTYSNQSATHVSDNGNNIVAALGDTIYTYYSTAL